MPHTSERGRVQCNDSAPGSLRAALPLLLAGFLIEFFVIGGGIDTVSVFLNALIEAEHWTHSSLSAAISVGVLSSALVTPAVGMLVDRWGVRVPMTIGLGLLVLGFGVLLGMTSPWHFVVANLLLGPGFAFGSMFPITIAVTLLVPVRTAFAIGLVTTGSSAGALILAPLLQTVVDAAGWRAAYVVLAAMVLLVPVPCLLFALPRGRLRPDAAESKPAEVAAAPSLREELRRPGLPALVGIMTLPFLVNFGVQVHLVPYLTDLGHTGTLAAFALGATIGVSAVGKVAGGLLGDRVGALQAFRGALLLQVAALLLLPFAVSGPLLALFVIAHGIAIGTEIAVTPVIAVAILGEERFGTLFGLLQLVAAVVSSLGPIVPGILFDASGSYDGALLFWTALMAAGAAVALWMRVPSRTPHSS
jgi:MFS family permease